MPTFVAHRSPMRGNDTGGMHAVSKHSAGLSEGSPWSKLITKTSSMSGIKSFMVSSTDNEGNGLSTSFHALKLNPEPNLYVSPLEHHRSMSMGENVGKVTKNHAKEAEMLQEDFIYEMPEVGLPEYPCRVSSMPYRHCGGHAHISGLSLSSSPEQDDIDDMDVLLSMSNQIEPSEMTDSGYMNESDASTCSCAELGSGLKSKIFRNRSLSFGIQQLLSREGITKLKERYIYRNTHHGFRKKDIGSGATATVQIVSLKPGCHTTIKSNGGDSGLFAVKTFRKKSRSERKEDYLKKLASEWTIQRRVNHPNVVRAVDLCLDDHALSADSWCEIMEFCAAGDLHSLIKAMVDWTAEPEPKEMAPNLRNCLFKQLLRGVSYLHSEGIAHRDIKPENLLLSCSGILKITDFGTSDVLFNKHSSTGEKNVKKSHGICGSNAYIAPEVFTQKEYDGFKVDIWSCAIVYFCLTWGGTLFAKAIPGDKHYDNYLDAFKKFRSKFLNPHDLLSYSNFLSPHNHTDSTSSMSTSIPSSLNLAETCSMHSPVHNTNGFKDEKLPAYAPFKHWKACAQHTIYRMLNPNPDERLSAEEVLNSRFVQRIECCSLDKGQEVDVHGKVDVSNKDCFKQMESRVKHEHIPLDLLKKLKKS